MKTYHILYLFLVTGIILVSGCKKDEQEIVASMSAQNTGNTLSKSTPGQDDHANWREDFTTSNSLSLKWNLFGSPVPRWVSSAFGRTGLFDNNGHLPDGSCAVSKVKIGSIYGYIIESEVYINITNSHGTIVCPEIGVTRYLDQPVSGISMKLAYIGTGLPNVPPDYQNHMYLRTSAFLQDGTISTNGDYDLQINSTKNGWHKMKIVVNWKRRVSFYLDNQLIWSPQSLIHESLLNDKNVMLGFSSPQLTGKAYHDWVKVTYPPPPSEPVLIESDPALFE